VIKSHTVHAPGYESFKVQELIAVAVWYIWWMRRRQAHGELVPPVPNCVNSIGAIAADSARANLPTGSHKQKS
jgi:hypothetical protein